MESGGDGIKKKGSRVNSLVTTKDRRQAPRSVLNSVFVLSFASTFGAPRHPQILQAAAPN